MDRKTCHFVSIGEARKRGARTPSCIEPPSTSFALVMLRFLMVDKNLEVVKVALAVVAPRAFQNFIYARRLALILVDHP